MADKYTKEQRKAYNARYLAKNKETILQYKKDYCNMLIEYYENTMANVANTKI